MTTSDNKPVKGLLGGLAEALLLDSIWAKGHSIPGADPNEWRRDDFDQTIRRSDYGNQNSPFGWQKDHITPVALGGPDALWNYRPLHCGVNSLLGGFVGAAKRAEG